MTTLLGDDGRHALHEHLRDSCALSPVCDENEFAGITDRMVADERLVCSPWFRSTANASTR
jgi:hypothetical protein